MQLNASQQEAVHYLQGPLLVLAGAGSGKTRVITEKIAHLVRTGMQPDRIVAITFTNKAAREMRARAGKLLSGPEPAQPVIGTFHALGLRFLQIEHEKLGLRRGFSVFDGDDSAALLKELLPKSTHKEALESARQAISALKAEGWDPEQAQQAARSDGEREVAESYARYQQRLQRFNAVDFDDLIRLPQALLGQDAEAAAAWRERIRYVLVDEYQDTNRAQYRWLSQLVGTRAAFTAVGDDDQSIYAWRGADPNNLRELTSDFPALKVIKLEQNYRSSRRILRAANAVIAHNPHLFEKKLWSTHAEGAPIRLVACADEQAEADRVAAEIAHQQAQSKSPWHEFAVLYRGNHQSKRIEKSLRLLRIPYHLTGGQSFFERTEVKDLLAYLRLATNPDDDAAFLRAVVAPKRDVGGATLEKLAEQAAAARRSLFSAAQSHKVLQHCAPRQANALAHFCALVDGMRQTLAARGLDALEGLLLHETGYAQSLRAQSSDHAAYERRIGYCRELVSWIQEQTAAAAQKNGLEAVASQLSQLLHQDRADPAHAVRLMTLHSAKGLEFTHVFLIGLEDGVLPHESSVEENRLEEERRLFYVGITRARQQLTLSYAKRKQRFGDTMAQTPSRFLTEIPGDDLYIEGQDASADAHERKERVQSHLERIAQLLEG